MIFNISPTTRVTFINKSTGEKWPTWKQWKDCSPDEKTQANLAAYPENSICFDRDLDTENEYEIMHDYEGYKTMLKKRGIEFFFSYRSPHGYHVIAPFNRLDSLSLDVKKEVKKYYVSLFESDPSKVSDRGVVSLPDRPHFKNGKTYSIIDNYEGMNNINIVIMKQAESRAMQNKIKLTEINKDKDFEKYFEEDPFWLYLKNNIIPDATNRDMTIFPNLALASIKSGKTDEEIKKIIEPVILTNFPGKVYAEFEGWLKKARSNDIKDYNPFQINTWMESYSIDKKEIYDMSPTKIEELKEEKKDVEKKKRINLIWNKDIQCMTSEDTKWIVDKWIPKGDICFIAGKSGTFKTTFIMHMGLAIANNKLVFNKYKVIPGKVLYINEEMNKQTYKDFFNRAVKGLQLKEINNFAISQEEGLKIDMKKESEELLTDIEFIANVIRNKKFDVVIFDSFRRFFTGDENDATKMSDLFTKLKKLRKICGDITIIVIHHLKKFPINASFDIKDMLRGSSDIVNSADSIISTERKIIHDSFSLMHVKNRSGPEMKKRLILVDFGEKGDEAYLYESKKNAEDAKTNVELCAEDIYKTIKEIKLKEFSRKEIEDKFKDKYSGAMIYSGLKDLESQKIIMPSGKGKNTTWIWNEIDIEKEKRPVIKEVIDKEKNLVKVQFLEDSGTIKKDEILYMKKDDVQDFISRNIVKLVNDK